MKTIEHQKLSKSKVIIFHALEHHAEHIGSISMTPAITYRAPQVYYISEPEIQKIKEVYEKNAQVILDRAEEIFREHGIHVETRLVFEHDPVTYIKKMVKEEQVDLVIIGSKGNHSLLEEILLGSVAEKVLRHVPCDILIVR